MADFSDKKIVNRRLAGKFKFGGLGWKRPLAGQEEEDMVAKAQRKLGLYAKREEGEDTAPWRQEGEDESLDSVEEKRRRKEEKKKAKHKAKERQRAERKEAERVEREGREKEEEERKKREDEERMQAEKERQRREEEAKRMRQRQKSEGEETQGTDADRTEPETDADFMSEFPSEALSAWGETDLDESFATEMREVSFTSLRDDEDFRTGSPSSLTHLSTVTEEQFMDSWSSKRGREKYGEENEGRWKTRLRGMRSEGESSESLTKSGRGAQNSRFKSGQEAAQTRRKGPFNKSDALATSGKAGLRTNRGGMHMYPGRGHPRDMGYFDHNIGNGLPGVWCLIPHSMDNSQLPKVAIPQLLLSTRTSDPYLLVQGLPDARYSKTARYRAVPNVNCLFL